MAQNPVDCTAKLIGLGEPLKDQEVPCVGVIKIGRDQKANNCPVSHASVSRQHAQIFNEGGTWVVEDLKSMNGVHVNEARVQKQRLKDGDIVRIGDVPFKFVLVQPVTQIFSKQEPAPEESEMTLPARPQPAAPPAAAAPGPPAPPPVAPPPPPPPPPAPPVPQPVAAAPRSAPPPPPPPPLAVPRPSQPKPQAAPAAPPPQPAARPTARPAAQPAAKQEEEGGDLFEPSIIGNVGADVAAAQAQARAGGRPAPASREPEDFEGTMYGPQVARQLVKAIREEKPEAETSSKARAEAPKVVVTTSGGSKPPSMFWLKFKMLIYFLSFVAACGAVWRFLIWVPPEVQQLRSNLKQLKTDVEEFTTRYEPGPNYDLAKEVGLLAEMRQKGETYASDCVKLKQPETADQLRLVQDKMSFLIFERDMRAAVTKDDLAAAERCVAEMTAKCDKEQKGVMKLASVAAAYEIFRHKYDSPPERAKKVPSRKDVENLVAADADLKNEYTNHGRSLRQYKLFSSLADNAINLSRMLVVQWKKFYDDYDQAKGKGTLDALKSLYPNLDDLVKDPNLK